MKTLARFALSIGLAAALLAACGGSQPPIGSPSAMVPTSANRGTSWTLPEASSGDLLYVTTLAGLKSYSYPMGKHVRTIKMLADDNSGVCSDTEGNIFVDYGRWLLKYKHGGKKPSGSLTKSGDQVFGCASDPTTGNLAVIWESSEGREVAVYRNARGRPKHYSMSGMIPLYCGYDHKDNLFCDGLGSNGEGFLFAELPKGGKALESVRLNPTVGWPGSVQWDGKYITVQDENTNIIYGFEIFGRRGRLKRTVNLELVGKQYEIGQPLIFGKTVVEATIGIAYSQPDGYVNFYRYPSGGSPFKTLTVGDDTAPNGVAVSAAPK